MNLSGLATSFLVPVAQETRSPPLATHSAEWVPRCGLQTCRNVLPAHYSSGSDIKKPPWSGFLISEPLVRFELTTCRLQNGCSTNWAKVAINHFLKRTPTITKLWHLTTCEVGFQLLLPPPSPCLALTGRRLWRASLCFGWPPNTHCSDFASYSKNIATEIE